MKVTNIKSYQNEKFALCGFSLTWKTCLINLKKKKQEKPFSYRVPHQLYLVTISLLVSNKLTLAMKSKSPLSMSQMVQITTNQAAGSPHDLKNYGNIRSLLIKKMPQYCSFKGYFIRWKAMASSAPFNWFFPPSATLQLFLRSYFYHLSL